MQTDKKWTVLHISELMIGNSTSFQFYLDDTHCEYQKNISLDVLNSMMAGFRANQLSAKDLSEYISSLVPAKICATLQEWCRKGLFLGIKTTRDPNAEHPFPFHTIPWEAAYVNGEDGETWAVAYSAVRIADCANIYRSRQPRKPEQIGLFCCEYSPPLAQRDAVRDVLEEATNHTLSEVREITSETAADDFMTLQSSTLFYASCHGEKHEDEAGKGIIGLVKPGCAEGDDRYFLTIEPGEGGLSCAELFANPPPAVFCLDACFSANDQRVPEYVIRRGCQVFIGNAFEAVQDSRKNGTPAVREILKQILTEVCDEHKGIGKCVSDGRRSTENTGTNIYHTLVYVNSILLPYKDPFGVTHTLQLPRWFLLVLLATVSLFVSVVLGKALIFRFLLTNATVFIKLLCNIGIGGLLFLIGLPTVPKST